MLTNRLAINNKKYSGGFSLIELMIVVVIIGIIAAIAYPLYTNYSRESRRSEATAMLIQVAARQERFFQDNKRYANNMTEMGYSAASAPSPNGYYLTSVTAAGINGYTLSAAPTAKKGQNNDTNCLAITFEHDGATAGGIKLPAKCW